MKKIILRIIPVTLMILALSGSLLSQTNCTIRGYVKDGPGGTPVPGVTILIQGTLLGATPDINGEYSIINVPAGTVTVIVSRPGYSDLSKTIVFPTGWNRS